MKNEYPFFTGTRVHMCRCTRCLYHDLNSQTSEGFDSCTLKVVELGSDGSCRTKVELPKPTVRDVREYFEEKGVLIKE